MKFVYYSEMFFVREEEREKCSQYFDRLSVVLSPTLSFNPLLGKKTGEGNGTPLQYSCLENPIDGGAWWAAVHGVAKSQT